MWQGVKVVQKPSELPISVADVKDQHDIVRDDQDAIIERFIRDGVAMIDGPDGIGYAMMEQTWRKSLDAFPYQTILLPGAPIKSVASITYIDMAGDEQTIDPQDYRVDIDREPVRIDPAHGKSWPSSRNVAGAIKVEYVLGEDDAANVPADLIDAVSMIVGHRYANREAVLVGSIVAEFPLGVQSTLDRHRRLHVTA